jgi:hypothetical protein
VCAIEIYCTGVRHQGLPPAFVGQWLGTYDVLPSIRRTIIGVFNLPDATWSSGVYFIRVEGDGFSETRQAVLVR